MMKQLLVTALAVGLMIGGSIVPGLAQVKKKEGASGRSTNAAATAMRARQKQCGAEWKAAKKAGTVETG